MQCDAMDKGIPMTFEPDLRARVRQLAKWRRHPPMTARNQQGLRELSPELIYKARDDTDAQVYRLVLLFVGTAAFCLLSLLSPDSALLGGNDKINVPLAGPVSFIGFMLLGPAVLILLWIYLQIYAEHGERLDRVVRRMPVARAPALVPLKNPLIRWFSNFASYLLLPVTMLLFAWKAAAFPKWGSGLLCVAMAVIASHALLPLRGVSWPFRAFLSVSAAIVAAAAIFGSVPYRRPFNLYHANLSGQLLRKDDLQGANLEGANLSRAELREAELEGANLGDANLTGAFLNFADLSGAELKGANLTGAILFQANLDGALLSAAQLAGADLRGANLTDAQLTTADLSGANLTDAHLTSTNFEFAHFHGGKLTNANLTDAKLESVDLSGANLSGANLTDAKLLFADLSGANLRGANLRGANLTSANLTGADLSGGVDLTRANLSFATVSLTQLSEACGTDAKLPWDHLTLRPCAPKPQP
jgi:uncharacterized protein YjbI with pentapeptide repeats